MANKLRVGVIGVSADRGWARESHVPAIRAAGGLELAAVATRTQETADAAGAAFGVSRAYGDAGDLIADPEVDIVTVAAPVPAHHDLIVAALEAGKHVITEWPVGTSTAQTEQIAAISAKSGLRTAVDLQSRLNPAAVRALALIESGTIGRVLSATVYSSTAAFGRRVADSALYLEKPETGMNLTTIQTAHTTDLAIMLAGRLTSLAALATIQYPELEAGDPPRPFHRVVPDHVLLHGRLAGGGALAIQVAGGRPAADTPFRMDVTGEDGGLTLEGGAARGFQAGLLRLRLNGEPADTTDRETAGLPAPVVNVARVYAALRNDITGGTSTTPDFGHAVRLSHLIDDIRTAATIGQTIMPTADWP
jgi:predicted dehydrogenase